MSVDIQQIKQRFGIIGNSPLLMHAIGVAVQVAPTDMSVLIIGESGVGKESFPKIIHQNSIRKHASYIAVNCGAIPEGTIDSELFGHLKGSFTGAVNDRKGYFQEASGGTIFLDEVGELPLSTQARLLRVLETGEFIPVGASQSLKTDVRIVAATNVNLQDAVRRGRFREDLLFRLNTVPIEIPALRARVSDIPLLFRYFALQSADKYHMPALRLTPSAEEVLMQYSWPGNIRELRNLTDRISILEEDREVNADTVRHYLSIGVGSDYRPALRYSSGSTSEDSSGWQSERDLIYQAIRDLRVEVESLRKLVLSYGVAPGAPYGEPQVTHPLDRGAIWELPATVANPAEDTPSVVTPRLIHPLPPTHITDIDADDAEYTPSPVIDEGRTLQDMERQMIVAALARHKGRRRLAAKELNISERTLYRKIKEYGLETN